MNVLSREEQLSVLHLLVEGNSLRSIPRLTGIHRTTTLKLLARIGTRCRAFLDRMMRNLPLEHLQCDEIWTFVLMKQGQVPAGQADSPFIGDQYLFVALDQWTKLIPSFVIGKRTRENAERFMLDLSGRIATPIPAHRADPKPQISTDGFAAYPGAVDLAFADTADFGVIVKTYRESEQPGRYGPPEMVDAERRVITGSISRRSICTSHVERHNLSIRTFLRRFTRLAIGFSKKLANLEATVSLYIAYYNFCWLHGSLPGTPAMAARLAGHPWTLEELLETL